MAGRGWGTHGLATGQDYHKYKSIFIRQIHFVLTEIIERSDFMATLTFISGCQYTRNASHGIIKFPLSGNYANGQLCSWSITVQASQTIRVHFSNFQLRDIYDLLIFYNGKDDSAPRLATLHGGYTLHDITSRFVIQSSSSNLFVVFRSSPTNTAAGFEADYTAIGKETL